MGYAVDSEGGVMWFNVSNGDEYIDPASGYVFEPYKEYRVMITLVTASDEYGFASKNRRATLNDMEVGFSDYGWNEDSMVYIESSFVCAPEGGASIREVKVYTDDPSVGDYPFYYTLIDGDLYRADDTDDDAESYISNGVSWYNKTDDCVMSFSDKFEEGKTYTLSVRLRSSEFPFAPASEITATVNGKTASVKRLTDRSVEVSYSIAMPGAVMSDTLLGDADNSGDVDIVDALILQRRASEIPTPYEEWIDLCGDVDGSGDVDIVDALLIQRYASEIATPYPIGE